MLSENIVAVSGDDAKLLKRVFYRHLCDKGKIKNWKWHPFNFHKELFRQREICLYAWSTVPKNNYYNNNFIKNKNELI